MTSPSHGIGNPDLSLARRSMTALGRLVVPHYDRRLHWYHRAIAEALEGMLRYVRFRGERGGYARVVISMPPRHGKSLHGTELFPALALGQNPDLKIMVAMNGARLAKDGVAHAQQWMTSPGYMATFGTRIGSVEQIDERTGDRLGSLETTNSALLFRTLKPKRPGSTEYVQGDGYYLAQGMGGSLTGSGFEIGIMDDLIKNAEQAMSDSYHTKAWAFYTSTFNTRANGEFAVQLYIGTRWREPDFADELVEYWSGLRNSKGPLPIKVIRLPAIAEAPLEEGDPREVGEPLDKGPPDGQFSREWYESERDALMATSQSWVWWGLYQQRPKMAGVKFFQPDDWVRYNSRFDLTALSYIDISIDANLSENGPSYACMLVTGVLEVGGALGKEHEGQHFFLLDEARGHWDLDTIEHEFVRLMKKWTAALPKQMRHPEATVWVENKALGPTLISKYGSKYPLVAVPKAKAKIWCYRVAAQITGMQRVQIPEESFGQDPTDPTQPLVNIEWVGGKNIKGSWVQEMMSHPSKPDDRRDVLAQQIICRTPHLGPDRLGSG